MEAESVKTLNSGFLDSRYLWARLITFDKSGSSPAPLIDQNLISGVFIATWGKHKQLSGNIVSTSGLRRNSGQPAKIDTMAPTSGRSFSSTKKA